MTITKEKPASKTVEAGSQSHDTPLPQNWKELGAMLDESMEDYYKGNYYTREEMDKHLTERRTRWENTP